MLLAGPRRFLAVRRRTGGPCIAVFKPEQVKMALPSSPYWCNPPCAHCLEPLGAHMQRSTGNVMSDRRELIPFTAAPAYVEVESHADCIRRHQHRRARA